jgi:hypothetical protein
MTNVCNCKAEHWQPHADTCPAKTSPKPWSGHAPDLVRDNKLMHEKIAEQDREIERLRGGLLKIATRGAKYPVGEAATILYSDGATVEPSAFEEFCRTIPKELATVYVFGVQRKTDSEPWFLAFTNQEQADRYSDRCTEVTAVLLYPAVKSSSEGA